MIIIGEKLNGSIPSVAKAIAEKDADLIRARARTRLRTASTALFSASATGKGQWYFCRFAAVFRHPAAGPAKAGCPQGRRAA